MKKVLLGAAALFLTVASFAQANGGELEQEGVVLASDGEMISIQDMNTMEVVEGPVRGASVQVTTGEHVKYIVIQLPAQAGGNGKVKNLVKHVNKESDATIQITIKRI